MMSIQTIYAQKTIGITDLKRSDTAFIDNLLEPIAVLKRDTVKAYLIPEKLMAYFMDKLDDLELAKTVNSRLKDLEAGKTQTIAVEINEL
ncbi:MAG: prevent-host-death protein [Burkholderiales bacterium]|jgi:PHD/YefM family antitoxin component YafN of YafNO toxin-antitoxin module|nr:prevent-host-death protein [Burkholderiales bacterium]